MAVKEDLEKLGFKVDFQVYAWATVTTKRWKKDQYNIFPTGFSFIGNAEPLGTAWANPKWAGWYESSPMAERIQKYVLAKNLSERTKLVEKIQSLFYEEVPVLRLGEYGAVKAYRKEVKGILKTKEPVMWNIWIEK